MAKYIIEGGHKLSGQIKLSGNKNAILPCMAAALLTEEEVVLENVPEIADVTILSEIMKSMGVEVVRGKHQISLKAAKMPSCVLKSEMVQKLRASILLVGSLLGRCGQAEFLFPGGDIIGRRGIDQHLNGFNQLGYSIEYNDQEYKLRKVKQIPKERRIFFENFATVTGTENLLLAAAIQPGTTVIRNAACEPHVIDLCNLLIKMGADIQGMGSSILTIEGVKKLKGARFKISSDHMEFGTYVVAGALTGGEVEIVNCGNLDFEPVIWPYKKMGISFYPIKDGMKIVPGKIIAIPRLLTNAWPGFPTDLMSITIVLATQAQGVSLLHDFIFESRMFFVDKLISMGAHITIADPHRVVVYGARPLFARNMETPDIRAGMALILAALVANGQSVINLAELIDRGYEDVVGKLTGIGAKVEKST
ncbi:MAG: UDP-N-acetylglucosamine 1-carboxyvinyltransferase [Armatimonadetes bacterium]|nr:MAG: UDP-N-acetylglucosamine 1-carboxyvinyltransferase [Armatimonadota bacterium]